ncbi:FUSC family protein [Cutibacterium equinum]|uniref:FUSC family protein n=1 Tax=Cutibacterium equinum TaxID=3016342 RepID=A0ABY7R0I6_9ACTN|nr:FUSC family protein [Cutibacterium equinum]WCC80811.1 FUSC family protein [Cutibacterium equinum]
MSPTDKPSSLRQLLRKLITIRPDPGRNKQAVILTIPMAVSLVTMGLLTDPTHAAMGMMGAMSALAGNSNAPLSRARILLGVGMATIFAQCLGLLSMRVEWLMPFLLAAWTLVVIWTWHALQLGPPGPLNILFAGAFGAYMASQGWTIGTILTSTGPSFLIAAGVSMIISFISPHRPVRLAVEKAETAVNRYCEPDEEVEAHEVARLRSAAHAAIHQAWWAYHDGHATRVDSPSEKSELSDLRARLVTAHMRLEHQLRLEAFPSADLSLPDHLEWTPLGRPKTSYLLRTALERGSRPTMLGLRAATGVFFSALLMILLPFGHPYWAILSVLILMHMDATRSDMTIRAIHRVLGTIVGLGLYLAVAAFRPSGWVQLGLIIVFLWTMQALITRNYGLSCIFITCFALLMTPLTHPGEMYQLAQDRIIETVVGLAVGIITIHVVGRRAPVLLVRSQYRRTLRSTMPVLRSLEEGHTSSPQAQVERNQMVHELIRGSALLSATRPDAPQALQDWSRVDRTVTETGYDLLSVCWHTIDEPVPWARRILADIAIFITGLPPISSQNLDAHTVADQVERIRRDMVTSLPGVE